MDLTTHYMGLQLKNPLIASASPLTGKQDFGRLQCRLDCGLLGLAEEHVVQDLFIRL